MSVGLVVAALLTPQAIGEAALRSFERFELQPRPEVIRVLVGDDFLGPDEWARSVLYESGAEEIYVHASVPAELIELAMDHEAAHLKAWRVHGPQIEMHGPEFLEICRAHAADPKSCKGRSD